MGEREAPASEREASAQRNVKDRTIRPPAVAGSWYPGTAAALTETVDAHLANAAGPAPSGDLVALIAPHAGLMYSGPVAAHAYRLLRDRSFDVAVLVGPSHFAGFDGAAVWPAGAFATPLGPASIADGVARALLAASSIVHELPAPHLREHSLEMQLPFLKRLAPSLPIVPVLVGYQIERTARALADALAAALAGRRALLIASTDLSHYHDARTAQRLDRVVLDCVAQFDADGLQRALDARPEHACGGGPAVAVMLAARALGASDAVVLHYADSGDVSGDKSSVVGYMAAALGRFRGERQKIDAMDHPAVRQTMNPDSHRP
jgi:AmmeMemoRadiSam system protein B